ncbi:claudin-7-like [Paramormyrops kingsleyae]|uniref:Claudin n=1 Tax=Paramormyrops kingsleyae TaxID=1676925 RepID=A0A3B3RCX4_9TELE|nr:claudin-7-like [Paramormyrops kingsleyae]XP_023652311.1 claudin-7-like [Paramormyrops kingsleyae]XP_023652312.1 claudin-7-like [Paramormyrops kingsleyae]XP_023652313.1 claudin-7-like [Paramormyrops kingsleyae]
MVVMAMQILGLLMGLVSWTLELSSTSSHVWKVKSHADAVTTSTWQFQGLWMHCAATAVGAIQCHRYKTVLGLPGYIQACRALMITSVLLGLFGVIISLLGMKFIKIGHISDHLKAKIATFGGIMLLLSGASSLTAVSWYASQVIQDFYNPLGGSLKFELGPGLYIGWGGASLAILGGALLCGSCRGSSTELPTGYDYTYSVNSQRQKICAPALSTNAYV